MKHYFIDMENVSSAGIHGAKNLNKDCIVHIFYSQYSKNISIEAAAELTEGKATVHYRKLKEAGHNAMDFELISIMSSIIGDKKEGEYYIISNDKGYTAAINCLLTEYSEYPIKIVQASSIANTLDYRNNMIKKHINSINKEKAFDERLRALLLGTTYEKHLNEIREAIKASNCKQELYTSFVKNYGIQLGPCLYRIIKSSYYNLKDSLQF